MPKNKSRVANQIQLTRNQIRQIFTPLIDDTFERQDPSAELSKEDSSRPTQPEVLFLRSNLLTFNPVQSTTAGDRCKSVNAEEDVAKMDPEVARCFSDIKQALGASFAELEKFRHCHRCKKVRLNCLREDTAENITEA